MGYGVKFKVWGEYACFTRPELKVERVSYDIMTPSAARGLLESIYWKPAIIWHIDKIHVLNPIVFTNIRRNEVSEVAKLSDVKKAVSGEDISIIATEARHQRAAMVLKNPAYVIEAHFQMNPNKAGSEDTEEKHYNIVLRRLREGKYFHHPCLGTREFGANFEIIEEGEEMPKSVLSGDMDFGFMLHHMGYTLTEDGKSLKVSPRFFRAKTVDGILDLTNVEVLA